MISSSTAEAMRRALIPPAFVDRLGDPLMMEDEAKAKCIEWVKSDVLVCILAGDQGRNKTAAACNMLSAYYSLNAHKAPVLRFVKQGVLYAQWLDSTRSGGNCELLERFCEPEVLVIDDIGHKSPTPGFHEFLFTVLDERMDNYKRTIFTTNYNSTQLKETFGEAFVSRMVSGTCIVTKGKDLRQQDNKPEKQQ